MKIKCFSFNPLATHCYVVYGDNEHGGQARAWIIDPSFCNEDEVREVKRFLQSEQLQVKKILCTHLHFDHIFGAKMAVETFQCPIYGHKGDEPWLEAYHSYAAWFGVAPQTIKATDLQHLYQDDTLCDEGLQAKVLEIPGHSQGSLAYYFPEAKAVFSGDALFAGSIGRTDMDGGDYAQLIDSIHRQLLNLPDDCQVYCGHGPATSIGWEKKENPYL